VRTRILCVNHQKMSLADLPVCSRNLRREAALILKKSSWDRFTSQEKSGCGAGSVSKSTFTFRIINWTAIHGHLWAHTFSS